MKRWLAGLLVLTGFFLTGCGTPEGAERRDVRLSDVRPQVEVTVQQ